MKFKSDLPYLSLVLRVTRGDGFKLVHIFFKFSPETLNSWRPPRQNPSSLSRKRAERLSSLKHSTGATFKTLTR